MYTNGLQAYEKMFNITNHKKNANQNHTLTGWPLSKEWKISDGKDVEKVEPLSTMEM